MDNGKPKGKSNLEIKSEFTVRQQIAMGGLTVAQMAYFTRKDVRASLAEGQKFVMY